MGIFKQLNQQLANQNNAFNNNALKNNQNFIKIKERVAILDWMHFISAKKRLQRSTCHLAICLFDKVISKFSEEKKGKFY